MKSLRPHLVAFSLAALLAAPLARAQQQDAPPVDTAQLLQALKSMREQQAAQMKALRLKAASAVQSAAASGAAAAAAWEEAVKQTQFNGADHEAATFRDWKEKEGDALKEPEVQNAARLYFVWLGITLQRSAGGVVKDMLPQIVQFTKEVTADAIAMDAFDEKMKREKERRSANAKEKVKDDAVARRMHDQILRKGLAGSPPVQAMKISDYVNVGKWEGAAGNVDGIFNNIILPELRAERDPRLLEYWDMKIKREGEVAAKSKLAFDSDKFTQVRRPELAWAKAQDEALIGQRNRAISDMFTLIKNYPAHPNAAEWIGGLEALLVPAQPVTPVPAQ